MSNLPTAPSPAPLEPPPIPSAVTHATIDEHPPVLAHLSFWQQPFALTILPFLTSLALHAALVLFGYLTLQAVVKVTQVVQEQIIIPEAAIVEGAPVGGVKNPGLGGDPNREARQDKIQDVNEAGWADKKGQSVSMALMGGGEGDTENGVIGVGTGARMGSGRGPGLGRGDGDGGPLAPFGVAGGGAAGPRTSFVGVSGNARRIAYVCDASGSMMGKFDSLRVELRRAVDVLKPIQSFSVIFFQEETPAAIDKALIMATPDNKRKAYDFLDKVSAHGRTDPIVGLKIAFDQQPQLIYLLTDGDFPDNAAVERYIAERNADKKIKINTIAFIGRSEEYEKVLQRIANSNGGNFKYVSDEDLGR